MEAPDIIILQPPAFNKTGIKSILTDRMKRTHPSFKFLTYATGVFHFQHKRAFRNRSLKEALHLVFCLDDRTMTASISSRLNPIYNLMPQYNSGFINPHVDLLAVKNDVNLFSENGMSYHFNGKHDNIVEMIDQLTNDFGTTAIPWFENRWKDLKSNELVNTGLDLIASWDIDSTMLRNELRFQMRRAKLIEKNLRHPVCQALKEKLYEIPGQSPEAYEEVPRLAYELLELYCGCHITM